jgi:hypothetical protein
MPELPFQMPQIPFQTAELGFQTPEFRFQSITGFWYIYERAREIPK